MHPACGRQLGAEPGRDAVQVERFIHAAAAHLGRTQHRHRAALLDISGDIGGGHVQAAAICVHLRDCEIHERLRREFGHGIEEGIHTHGGECAQLFRKLCKSERISLGWRQLAAFGERLDVACNAHCKALGGFPQAWGIVDQNQSVRWEVIECGRPLRIDQRQILVRRRERAGFTQALHIAPNILFEVGMLFATGFQRGEQLPA